jgi:TonB-dependent starch-binding outer membrane protein SusC
MMNKFYQIGRNVFGLGVNQLMSKSSILVALFAFFTLSVSAQDITVSGKVTDKGGDGLPGVTVQLKGTGKGASTDGNGNFSLAGVPSTGTLVFSFVGMTSQEISVGGRSTINVTLADDAALLEEVVVVGYGEQKKRDITGSVSALKTADFNPGVIPSADQLMQGRATGVQVVQNNGSPGAKTSVRIRGGTSISAGNDPLYVVDGVPLDNSNTSPESKNRGGGIDSGIPPNEPTNPLNFLNPSDIASIDILKDASATAIYGARAANGVVLITTKRGVKGQTRVTYDGYYGISSLRKKVDILNAADWKAVSKANGGVAGGSADVDLYDAIFQQGMLKNHAIGFSGGSDNTNYYVSVGYMGQEGIVKGGDLERLSARVNLQQKSLNDKLHIDFGLTGSRERGKQVPASGNSGDFRGGILAGLFKWNPTTPLLNPDGTYNQISQSVPNPLALAGLIDDRTVIDRMMANISAEYEIIPGLKAKVFVAANTSSGKRNSYFSEDLINYTPYGGVASLGNTNFTSYQIDYTANYFKKIGENQSLSLLGGFSYQNFDNSFSSITTRNFLNGSLSTNKVQSASDFTVPSTSDRQFKEIQSTFARANYDIAGKYLLTATIRRDGASVFGTNNKYGIFPSFSAGWRISDEEFMKNQTTFTNLKLRAGWGKVGTANIEPYQSLVTYNADPRVGALLGGSFKAGSSASREANADLQWESTSSINIGLDYGILNNKIQGSVEFFNKLTDNLLYKVDVPQPAPATTVLRNVASMKNTGVEFDITTTNIDTKSFSWKTQFNFTTLKNEVTSTGTQDFIYSAKGVGAGASNAPVQILIPGYPVGTYLLTPIKDYGPEVGGAKTPIYGKDAIDLVKSGEAISFGSGLPTWYGGLNNSLTFGGIDASIFMQYSGGNKVLNNTFYEYSRLDNISKNAYGAVRPLYNDKDTKFNSDFLESGDFLRISNITLGYNIPKKTLGKTLNSARVYVSGQNLHVFTKYRGFDPAINTPLEGNNGTSGLSIDYLAYPLPRNLTFGVSLSF